MAMPHAGPAEVIDIRPLGTRLKDARTITLLKTDAFEVIRLVLPAGKELKPHQVSGEITVQCLEGRVAFYTVGAECELLAGNLLYLAAADSHALRAIEDSSLLVTILFKHEAI